MLRRIIAKFLLVVMAVNIFAPYSSAAVMPLPAPGTMLALSGSYSLPVLKGLKIDAKNPLNIDFILDPGTDGKVDQDKASLLVKYFLAALTTPQDNLWVNLSPYEQNRIIPQALSQTDLGAGMLEQDYLLKQLASSLTYPESDIGKKYWDTMGSSLRGAQATKQSQSEIAAPSARNDNTQSFTKVWITAPKATVYEGANSVMIVDAKLTAMMESDYLAEQNNRNYRLQITDYKLSNAQAFKQNILPSIEHDVNYGKNFANLRQIYNAVILGKWFKEKFKESFYKAYFNQNKTKGIDTVSKEEKDRVYNLYCEAFKKGAYNYTKKDYNPYARIITKRQYFSGGIVADPKIEVTQDKTRRPSGTGTLVSIALLIGAAGLVIPGQAKASQDFDAISRLNKESSLQAPVHVEWIMPSKGDIYTFISMISILMILLQGRRINKYQWDEFKERASFLRVLRIAWGNEWGSRGIVLTDEQISQVLNIREKVSKGWLALGGREIIGKKAGDMFQGAVIYLLYSGELAVSKDLPVDRLIIEHILKAYCFSDEQIKWLWEKGFLGTIEKPVDFKVSGNPLSRKRILHLDFGTDAKLTDIEDKYIKDITPVLQREFTGREISADMMRAICYAHFEMPGGIRELTEYEKQKYRKAQYEGKKFTIDFNGRKVEPKLTASGEYIVTTATEHENTAKLLKLIRAGWSFNDAQWLADNGLVGRDDSGIDAPKPSNVVFLHEDRLPGYLDKIKYQTGDDLRNTLIDIGDLRDPRAREPLFNLMKQKIERDYAPSVISHEVGVYDADLVFILEEIQEALQNSGVSVKAVHEAIARYKTEALVKSLAGNGNNTQHIERLLAALEILAKKYDFAQTQLVVWQKYFLHDSQRSPFVSTSDNTGSQNRYGGLSWNSTNVEHYGQGNFYFENIRDIKAINSIGFVINAITPDQNIGQFLQQ